MWPTAVQTQALHFIVYGCQKYSAGIDNASNDTSLLCATAYIIEYGKLQAICTEPLKH